MPSRLSWSAAPLLLLLPTGPAHPQTPVGPPLNAKAQETLMGPASQRVVLSPDGDHLAIVAPKGSRTVVLLDGVEGPVFDEIPMNFSWSTYRGTSGSMVFSPTGGHSAYVGRRGGDFIAVVDGKEAATLSTPAFLQGVYVTPGWKFAFNRDGSRLAYGALTGPGAWVMVVDGVKSPVYKALDFTQFALNGKRLAYVAQTADQKWHVVVDGKPGPGYVGVRELKLTPDGLHYAYLVDRPVPGGRNYLAVIDGVEGTAYFTASGLEQAPDGRVSYMVTTKLGDAQGRGGEGALLVAGMSVNVGDALHFNASTYDKDRIGFRVGSASSMVAWSPDGKRAAWVQRNTPNPGVTVMVNGKPMGPTYLTADELLWSPDGTHLTYQGNSPTGTFAVVDGQEFGPYNGVQGFQWSSDGKRYVFQGAASTGLAVVVDGKVEPKTRGVMDGSLLFSPDGKHLAYGGQVGGRDLQPMVDGAARPHFIQQFNTNNNPKILFPILSWSPDGNRIAYVGITMEQLPKAGVVVDGTLYPGPSAGFQFPSWSPNSKHFATAVWIGRGWTMMVDGKLGPTYEDAVVSSSAAIRFIDDHTLRFYGVKAGQIFRVTLDLGA